MPHGVTPIRQRRLHIVLPIALGTIVVAWLAVVAFRYYRFRDLREKLSQAEALLGRVGDPAVRRDLAAHLDYLRERMRKPRRRDILYASLLGEAGELYDACRGKFPAPHLRPGHHVIATVSQVDGAVLPTSVAVPEGWDGAEPLPLVLFLHAAGVRETTDCFPADGHPGALCVEPFARGSHDYMGVQMTAVEDCLADVRRRYPVARLYVLGSSMGGLGTWLFAERHVAEVSGVSPWMANADPAAWQGLWKPEAKAPASASGRACAALAAARMPVARVEQLASRPGLPIYVGHGADDAIVPVGHSDSMVEKLRKLGARSLRFDRRDGLGHADLPQRPGERIEWLRQRATDARPGELTAIIPPLTFVADCPGLPPHRVVDPLKEAKLLVRDGKVAGGDNVAPADAVGPSKWHYPGPAGLAFEHAFSIGLPPDAPEHLRQCADDLAALWKSRYGGDIRRSDRGEGFAILPPRENPRELRTLIALGSPAENPAVKAALEGLDARVEAARARLFGRDFAGEDIGLILLRPRRADPFSATLVVWGSTPASYRQLWARFGQRVHLEGDRGRWWFDYALFDRRTCGPESFLAVGFFDHGWRFEPSLLFEGSTELRARMTGSNWVVAGEGNQTWLSGLAPESIESPRGPVDFDRSAGIDAGALTIQGEKFEHGLGVTPPATIRWRLGRRYSKLRAKVGLERTGSKFLARYEAERVQFEVWADGFCVAASPILSATDGIAELTVDIRGADLVELRAVNTTKFVWHYGPAGWGEAELSAEPGQKE